MFTIHGIERRSSYFLNFVHLVVSDQKIVGNWLKTAIYGVMQGGLIAAPEGFSLALGVARWQ
jgi:hypothetical protein